jgi:hypothetical protein
LDGSKCIEIGGVKAALIFGGNMLKIDMSILDTQGKLLFNISEQLQEIIDLLKPQKTNEELMERFRELQGIETHPEKSGFKCNCGKPFDTERQLRGHQIKCKNKGV